MKTKDFPHEFLGRCSTCLDNAYLDSKPCKKGYGNGMPLNDDDCCVIYHQKIYMRDM